MISWIETFYVVRSSKPDEKHHTCYDGMTHLFNYLYERRADFCTDECRSAWGQYKAFLPGQIVLWTQFAHNAFVPVLWAVLCESNGPVHLLNPGRSPN